MVTTTYLVLIAALAVGLWWFTARSRRRSAGSRGAGPAGARLRAVLVGVTGGENDLVARMAACLVDDTTVFGSSYAIPGHLGAELPPGVFDAASAVRPRLTREVVDRFCTTMVERSRRYGRPDFTLPEGYALSIALACGPSEAVVASFTPIVDVRAALSAAGRGVPTPVGAAGAAAAIGAGDDRTTTRRAGRPDPGAAPGETVQLHVDGVSHATRRLGGHTPVLTVGRGRDVDLRCPDDLHDVSRWHAELTRVDGRTYVADRHSANGTWLQRADGTWLGLTPGTPEPLEAGDVVWLDTERDAKVSLS